MTDTLNEQAPSTTTTSTTTDSSRISPRISPAVAAAAAAAAAVVVPEFSDLHRDDSLHVRLDDCFHEVVDDLADARPHATLQSCKTTVLLRTLDWCNLGWNRLGELTRQTTFVQPETAARLSELILLVTGSSSAAARDPALAMLQQSLVRPDKLGKALTNHFVNDKKWPLPSPPPPAAAAAASGNFEFTLCLGNGGSPTDEVDAILAVDGLASPRPFPNFDLKRYVHRCSIPISPPMAVDVTAAATTNAIERRDPMFERDTTEEEDERRHVYAVRQLYGLVPARLVLEEDPYKNNRIVCRIVYRALARAFGSIVAEGGPRMANLLVPPPLDDREVDAEIDFEAMETTTSMSEEEEEDETYSFSSSEDVARRDFVEDDLIPALAETHLQIVGRDRAARLARRLLEDKKKSNNKPETRGRKRKVGEDEDHDGNGVGDVGVTATAAAEEEEGRVEAEVSAMNPDVGKSGADDGTTTTTAPRSSSSKKQKKSCGSEPKSDGGSSSSSNGSSGSSDVKKHKQPKQKTPKRTDSAAAAEDAEEVNYIYV